MGLDKSASLQGETSRDRTPSTGEVRDTPMAADVCLPGGDLMSSENPSQKGSKKHPAWSLEERKDGFGIGGAFERPYRRPPAGRTDSHKGLYGPIPHAGYYGANDSRQRFGVGQATYKEEIALLERQWVEKTSGSDR